MHKVIFGRYFLSRTSRFENVEKIGETVIVQHLMERELPIHHLFNVLANALSKLQYTKSCSSQSIKAKNVILV
jgi:hypothetical protein